MGRKLSVYVGEQVERALGGAENQSGRLEAICARYQAIVDYELNRMPLTRNEWCAALEANKGVDDWGSAWAKVFDAEGLSEKWEVSQKALAAKLRKFTPAQMAAFAEICELVWRNAELPTDEALTAAGVKVL